tara:strand:- start:5 stop:343 length:339 start_codon:yes stop_codon:yes gene_type:complete
MKKLMILITFLSVLMTNNSFSKNKNKLINLSINELLNNGYALHFITASEEAIYMTLRAITPELVIKDDESVVVKGVKTVSSIVICKINVNVAIVDNQIQSINESEQQICWMP